tara:strand:- start:2249 stop:2725 length:477 start_codon:yes stop_codon:yes gene_type:complete
MELAEFIKKRRSVERLITALPIKNRTKIQDFIDELEDEIVRLSEVELSEFDGRRTESVNPLIEITPVIEAKNHFTDNWKYDKDVMELNLIHHCKRKNIELGERPLTRKVYCIADVRWLEDNYPNLYKKQMQNAYNRMSVKESWDKSRNLNHGLFNELN